MNEVQEVNSTPSPKPAYASSNVLVGRAAWSACVASALASAKGVQAVFRTTLSGQHPADAKYHDHSGLVCTLVDAIAQPNHECDEAALPLYRVRFDDGVSLVAFGEELHGVDGRMTALDDALCKGFAFARERNYDGPEHLLAEADDDVIMQFVRALTSGRTTVRPELNA